MLAQNQHDTVHGSKTYEILWIRWMNWISLPFKEKSITSSSISSTHVMISHVPLKVPNISSITTLRVFTLLAIIGKQVWMLYLNLKRKRWTANFCIDLHASKGPVIIMNQLKSIYNSQFKDSHSHSIHTCFLLSASNDDKIYQEILVVSCCVSPRTCRRELRARLPAGSCSPCRTRWCTAHILPSNGKLLTQVTITMANELPSYEHSNWKLRM